MSLLVYKISKWIQQECILDRISFYLPKGCLVALLGPSGSGKSTLLRVIAGLETPMTGSVWLNGRDHTKTPIQYRKMGFVFQNFALFEHMTVTENIDFGLRLRSLPEDEIKYRVHYFLECLRIADLAYQYPHQLSGGQKQRVALARSLVIEPEFLLLDEPFKALDSEIRIYLNVWLKTYIREKGITAIMVTHDQMEALATADEIIILNQGHLTQQAKPAYLYDNPINTFVGQFLGPLILGKCIDANCQGNLRPYELSLQKQPDHNTKVARIDKVVYKRYLVELDLFLGWNLDTITLQLGYSAFINLQIENLPQFVYLNCRPIRHFGFASKH